MFEINSPSWCCTFFTTFLFFSSASFCLINRLSCLQNLISGIGLFCFGSSVNSNLKFLIWLRIVGSDVIFAQLSTHWLTRPASNCRPHLFTLIMFDNSPTTPVLSLRTSVSSQQPLTGFYTKKIQPNLSFRQVELTTWLSSIKYQYTRKFLYQPRKWLFGQPARKLSVDPWLI